MKYVVLLISLLYLTSCTEDVTLPCNGFTSEPTLGVKINKNDSFGIAFYNSRGIGDTVFAFGDEQINLPIDMNDTIMFYEVLLDTSIGNFSIYYHLTQELCTTTDELNLLFSKASFRGDKIINQLFTNEKNVRTAIDSNAGYSKFINNTLIRRHLEIQL